MPTPEIAPKQLTEVTLTPNQPDDSFPTSRVRLGGEELAICASIGLSQGSEPTNVVLLDVGFRGEPGHYGPYDIDGTGKKRYFSTNYVLAHRVKTKQGVEVRTFELDASKKIELGRDGKAAKQLGYGDDTYVSRKHATLQVLPGGTIRVEDEGSTNGTRRRQLTSFLEASDTSYDYTSNFLADVSSSRSRSSHESSEAKGWGYGEYEGRPIIGRDTPIDGGVDVYVLGRAVVVDTVKYPKEFEAIMAKVESRLGAYRPANIVKAALNRLRGPSRGQSTAFTAHVLNAVYGEVSKALQSDVKRSEEIDGRAVKVQINEYIMEGVGVCRHQAILAATIMEKLVNKGAIKGRLSIDRNKEQDVDGAHSGHEWVRFTDTSGVVYVIDPAQKFVGTLEEALARDKSWDYRRTEDLLNQLY